jgi:hypothetical protein
MIIPYIPLQFFHRLQITQPRLQLKNHLSRKKKKKTIAKAKAETIKHRIIINKH